MESAFFDGWFVVLRTVLIGGLAYIACILLLRISGKRTLSKMNAFDLVVTVALGSTLATILLDKDVSFVQGVAALALLIGLQFMVTWSSVRARWIQKLVKAEPSLLYYRGRFLQAALTQERVTRDEVYAAVRSAGLSAVEDAEAVVLETDASFSVVKRSDSGNSSLTGMQLPTDPNG